VNDNLFERIRKRFTFKLLVLSVVVLFLLIIVYTSFDRGDERLRGELGTIGAFGIDDRIIPLDCSNASLRASWDEVFEETSENAGIIAEDDCDEFEMYKINPDSNEMWFLTGQVLNFEREYYEIESAHLVADNLFLECVDVRGTQGLSLESLEFCLEDGEDLDDYLLVRNIENLDEAIGVFETIYNVEIEYLNWGDQNYEFLLGNLNEGVAGRVYSEKNIERFMYVIEFEEPDPLALVNQTANIPNFEFNHTELYTNVLDLDDYFSGLNDVTGLEIGDISLDTNEHIFVQSHLVNSESVLDVDLRDIAPGNYRMKINIYYDGGGSIESNEFTLNVYNCKESDSGEDLAVRGITSNKTQSYEDHCYNDSGVWKLTEYYCVNESDVIESYIISCESDYYCSGGECIENVSVNHAPFFDSDECGEIEWEKNSDYELDLDDCFSDSDGDNISFRYDTKNSSDITIARSGNILTITSDSDWIGTGDFYVYANDSKTEVRRDVDFVVRNVVIPYVFEIKGASPENETQTYFVGDNKTFSIDNEDYDNISWYLNGVILDEDSNSYTLEDMEDGTYNLEVEIERNGEKKIKKWVIEVEGDEIGKENLFDTQTIILITIIVVILIIIMLVVWLFIAEMNSRNKKINNSMKMNKNVLELNPDKKPLYR